jgi:DNA polymerase I-like protein with 3'-5' exonuclease and polymerase domains
MWHMTTAKKLRTSRCLVTPFGRRRIFFNGWNESLVKEGYAYVPQSVVADLLNMGLRRLHERIKKGEIRGEILLQIHDAVLLQTGREGVQEVARQVRETLTIPIVAGGKELVIPVDVSVGENWDELEKVRFES